MPSADAPPRVLHVVDGLRVGGAERLVVLLVEALARERLARNAVCVTGAGAADLTLLARVREAAESTHLVAADSVADPRTAAGVLAALRASDAAVVHAHLAGAVVASRLAALAARRPHVATIHTLPGPGMEETRLRAAAALLTSPLSARVTAPAREVADAHARSRWVPAGRVVVVPNAGVAPPRSPGFDHGAVRRRLGAGAGPLVVCVARLQPEKGVGDLVDAAAALRERIPGVRVVVAGDGPERERLEQRIAAAGLGGAVALLGRRGDVGDLLAAADAFCLPSWHEGVPLSVLEAMSAGLPCVATDVGGVGELLAHGEAGLLVPPRRPPALADALARVLADPVLAVRLGTAARERAAAEHAPAVVARRFAALYRELAGLPPLEAPGAAAAAARPPAPSAT